VDGSEPAVPAEAIPYILCDPCIEGDCAQCIGLTHSRPFCGHRCGFLEVIDDDPLVPGC